MDIEAAIQQYLIGRKDTVDRRAVEFDLAVLARLQEYLVGDEAGLQVEEVRCADLLGFIRSWYREDPDVTPAAAERLVGTLVGWSRWLDAQVGGWAARLESLVEELPRTARVAELLRRHVARHDLLAELPIEGVGEGSPLGTIGSGVTKVVRPKAIDYDHAEEDEYEVTAIQDRDLTLSSPTRVHLGEGLATPVRVPAQVAGLVRVGDRLHVEIAPGASGWEILSVESVSPGSLDERS